MQYFTFDDEGKPVAGERFRPLVKDLRRIPVHVEEPSLDVPALQMVEQPVEVDTFFRLSVPAVAEQVIEVPKISCPSHAGRAALREPQMVEQLVEVPTVLTYSLLQQRTAEQLVDNPAPHGRGSDARGGLQGLSQGQGSSAVSGAVHVNTLVPHVSGGGARGGLQGLSQGQGSTAVCGADHVDTRGGVARGGLPGFSQGQGSTAVCGAEHGDTRGGVARGGLPGLSQGQGSTAVCGAEHVDTSVPHGRGGGARGGLHGQSSTASAVEQTVGVHRGGPQGFPRGQSSTASAVEQNLSQDPHRSLPRAPVHGRHDEWVCVIGAEDGDEYYWNRWDNSTCWRLPRGVKHRWYLLPSGHCRDIVLQVDFRVLPPL